MPFAQFYVCCFYLSILAFSFSFILLHLVPMPVPAYTPTKDSSKQTRLIHYGESTRTGAKCIAFTYNQQHGM